MMDYIEFISGRPYPQRQKFQLHQSTKKWVDTYVREGCAFYIVNQRGLSVDICTSLTP